MAVIEIRINDQKISVAEGISILEAARQAGIYIPSLCHHPSVPASTPAPEKFIYQGERRIHNEQSLDIRSNCNLCFVQVQGRQGVVKACETTAVPGMVVRTESEEIRRLRKDSLTAILAHHPNICLTCDRDPRCPPFGVCSRSATEPDRCVACPGFSDCELVRIADHIGMIGITISRESEGVETVDDNPFFDFNPNLCVGCTRCVRFCQDVRGIGALGYVAKDGRILTGTKAPTFLESGCQFCFGCVEVCPTGALVDKKRKWKEVKKGEARKKDIVPCMAACPLRIDIPNYIHAVTRKNYDKALSVIEEKLPFASLCGTVCTHPCEAACRRGEMDRPVAIKDLKRFVSEAAQSTNRSPVAENTDKRVAIVGSGPAGLAAAYFLRKNGGHRVTVFEGLPAPGGMALTGIPKFRLPQQVLDAEIEKVRQIGVDIITAHYVVSVEALIQQGYDAVLLSVGAHEEILLGIEGEDSPAVMGALDLLRRVNLGEAVQIGKRVAVIGGGNVALDAARVVKRLGAADVTVVYRRSEKEMPALSEEILHAAEEEVRFEYLVSPVRFVSDGRKVIVDCLRNKLKRPDASGRRRPKPIKGSAFSFEVDTVVTAIGQYTRILDELQADADVTGRYVVPNGGRLKSREGVFAAGDAVSGPGTVTEAIAMGAKAANAIHQYLGGKELVDVEGFNPSSLPSQLEPGDTFLQNREPMPMRDVSERVDNFDQVALGFSEAAAVREAGRCLRCSLRLEIEK